MKVACALLLGIVMIGIFGCGGGGGSVANELNIKSISPSDGTTGVGRSSKITITFDDNLNASSVSDSTLHLTDLNDSIFVKCDVTVHDNIVELVPQFRLCPNRNYKVIVDSDVKSVSGTKLKQQVAFYFTTTSNQWSNSELIAQSNQAKTVLNNDGKAITVWWKYNNTNSHYEIQMSQFDGNAWSQPQLISGSSASVYNPSVAMDNNGNAIIIWEDWGSVSTSGGIMFMEYRNGSWSSPRLASNMSFPAITHGSVAMNDNGNAIIVWSDNSVNKIEYVNGVWSQPVIVSNDFYAKYPDVRLNQNGEGLITWTHSTSSYGQNSLYSTELRQGSWSIPHIISVQGVDPNMYQVAFDDMGNAIVVWQQLEGSSYRIYRNEYSNHTWSGPIAMTPQGVSAFYAKVSMDNIGNAIIVWQQVVNSIWQVFMSEYRSGQWNDSTITSSASQAKMPLVKMDASGNAILLWNQESGTDWQLFRKQYVDGFWQSAYLVATSHNQLNNITYDVSMSGSGDIDMVWDTLDQNANSQLFRCRLN
jgi:hypothetical protein